MGALLPLELWPCWVRGFGGRVLDMEVRCDWLWDRKREGSESDQFRSLRDGEKRKREGETARVGERERNREEERG